MPVVLVTGCSSGFGRHTALAFAARGYTVYATARSREALSVAVDDPENRKPDLHWLALDVTDRHAVHQVVADVIRRSGRIDVLVNNAGIHIPGSVEDVSDEDIELVMRTNFFGPVWLTRCVLPYMRAQKSGRIIMVSSLSALVGLPVESLYCASKAALEGFAEGLRYEVDRFGIRVSAVEPGLFKT
ncbi:MAG: SDR family oxidoreductase, partial [Gammaproteobacteria bacterium]